MIDDGEEYRRTADEILSRSEFREDPPSLAERALDWFFREFGELFGGVLGSGGGYLVGYLILAVALALAGYFVWRFFPRRRLASSEERYHVGGETTVRLSRKEWLARADEAETNGDWEAAVHARYHALTTGLADDEKLPAEESVTSGEHRRAFAAIAPPLVHKGEVAVFDSATDRYEEVYFGGDGADRPDSQQLAEADRQLLGSRNGD